jgi:hypothetical protein
MAHQADFIKKHFASDRVAYGRLGGGGGRLRESGRGKQHTRRENKNANALHTAS